MNIEQFLQRLSAAPPPLSAGELKSLEQFTDYYPWCGIAQQLLLEAYLQQGQELSRHQTAKAAIYVINRERLFQRLQHIRTQPHVPETTNTITAATATTAPAPTTIPTATPPVTGPAKKTMPYNPGDYFSGETLELSESDPVSSFLIKKPQLRPVASALNEVEVPEGIELHEPMPAQVTIVPQNFDDLVTETLAKIYEDQGLVSLAMATYEKLSLREPKKSTYFATRMQNLKFKIKS